MNPLVLNFPQEFTQGQFLFWTLTTQTGNPVNFSLQDSTGYSYFNVTRNSTDPLNPTPITGGAILQAGGLTLTITIPGSTGIQASVSSSDIYDSNNVLKGEVFTVATEDGGDLDFNDSWSSFVAWNTTG